MVQQRANAGKHVALVGRFTGFNAGAMLASGKIPPNANGYAFMAARWYAAIDELLPN